LNGQLLPHDWWESSVFASSASSFGFAPAQQDAYASNNVWEDLYGDIELFLMVAEFLMGEQTSYWQHKRLDWDWHVEKLLPYMKTIFIFDTICHTRNLMPLSSFYGLKWLQILLFAALDVRVLAGGNYDDIMNTYGNSKGSLYYARNKFLSAVFDCDALDVNLPTKASEWEKPTKACEWEKVSTCSASLFFNLQVLTGCCGAINRFFQSTKCRMVKESDGFPQAYFSGNYQSYCGLHCQAICDSRLKFLLFSIIALGQTNDAAASSWVGSMVI
jgi:hypothetical protein